MKTLFRCQPTNLFAASVQYTVYGRRISGRCTDYSILMFALCCYLQMSEMTSQREISTSEMSAAGRPSTQSASCDVNSRLKRPSLLLYPVYKPVNLDVRGPVVDRPRPLSYHWLTRRCAGHIHVKADLVERYVERLELLYVVPDDRHDARQQMLRCSLFRRCFARVVSDSGKLPRQRRRRKTTNERPAKILL